MIRKQWWTTTLGRMAAVAALAAALIAPAWADPALVAGLEPQTPPTLTEEATLTFAPNVPPPITRREPAVVVVRLEASEAVGMLMEGVEKPTTYRFWGFNGHTPGPFIRLREGDVMELHFTNKMGSAMPHNVDFHAVNGPGGGAKVTMAAAGQERIARFKMLSPGLYVYHCATPPIPHHIANGMYGLLLVEPEGGLPPIDHEYYVMQSEFYTKGAFGDEGLQAFSPEKAQREQPTYVVFNGQVGSMLGAGALKAKTGERIRLFVGNGGPNLVSSFHVIGAIFDTVYAEGSTGNPENNVQTTLIPAGGSAIVEFPVEVPGDYTMVDHSIFRIEKGALGAIHVEGDPRSDLYDSIK